MPCLDLVNGCRACPLTKFTVANPDGDSMDSMIPVLLAGDEYVPFHERSSKAIIDLKGDRGTVMSGGAAKFAPLATGYTKDSQPSQAVSSDRA